jgi:hypothetical protein
MLLAWQISVQLFVLLPPDAGRILRHAARLVALILRGEGRAVFMLPPIYQHPKNPIYTKTGNT